MQLAVHFQSLVNRDIQLLRNHLRDRIYHCIRQIHHPSHVTDHAAGCQRTKRNNLYHTIFPIFAHHIINHFLPSFKTEIHVDIRHRHPLRIQEPLKQQVIADRVKLRDSERIRYQASRRRPSPRPYNNIIVPRIFDKIPHNQEIIYIPHLFDGIQFIVQPLLQSLCNGRIQRFQPFKTELI